MQLYLPVRSAVCAEAPVATNAAARPTVKDNIFIKSLHYLGTQRKLHRAGGTGHPLRLRRADRYVTSSSWRACPGHPRFPLNGNEERGCPGPVSAKATPGPRVCSAGEALSEDGKPGHDDVSVPLS